jgi:hypothetical protein
MSRSFRPRIVAGGDVSAISEEDARGSVMDILALYYSDYAPEERPTVWLKDGFQTGSLFWFEWEATLIPRRRRTFNSE